MKTYHIMPEYLTLWGEDTTEDTVITTEEIERLAAEWGKPVEELMDQLTENEEEDPTMKRISIDNGANYITPEEAVQSGLWDAIVNFMDDDTREAVAYEGYDDNVAFLTRYLELADDDLIIG